MCIQFTDLVFIVSCFQEGRGNVALYHTICTCTLRDVSKDEIDEAKKSLAVLSSLDVPCITRLNESTIWYVATL